MGATGTSAGCVLLVSAGPFSRLPPAVSVVIARGRVAVVTSSTATIVHKRATPRHGGVSLKKEACKRDCVVAPRREPDYLAHVGADVRFPGPVGFFTGMIDVAGRIGQCVLLGIPDSVWESLVREAISIVFGQEPPQIPRVPLLDIRTDPRAANVRSK